MQLNLDDWHKLPAQQEIYEDDITDTLMMSAGLGSGKSYVAVRKALKLSAINRNSEGGFLVPAYSDFRRDIQPLFKKILSEELGLQEGRMWGFHNTYKEYRFCWSKAPLYIFTAEKPIAGPNLSYCIINEFSLMEYERVNEMLRRVRAKNAKQSQRLMVGTPEDIYAWLPDFIDMMEKINKTTPNKFRKIHADTRENIFVDPNYRSHLEATLDAQSLQVYAQGHIVKIGGNYFYYSFNRSRHVSEASAFIPDMVIHCGMDFNVDKFCVNFSHKIGNKQYFFDELTLREGKSTYDMATAIKQRYPDHWQHRMIITCDASGNQRRTSALATVMTDVAILKHEGLNVRFKTANPRLRERQMLINGMFEHDRILISPNCKETIRDLSRVMQKSDYTKDPGSKNELGHMSDGLDYVLDFEHKADFRGHHSISSIER